MKTGYRIVMSIVLVATIMSCRDRASEKRIAELESRLAQMETNKPASPKANFHH